MGKRLKIVYLPHPPHLVNPWLSDVEKALNSKHEFRVFDYNLPVEPQIKDVDVVIDHGGKHGTHEMADLARSVKLWQILGSGFDKFDLPYWRQKGIPVAHTAGQFSAAALSECALMFIFMLARRWHQTQIDLGNRVFYATAGRELVDLRLLLFGFGASARALALRALGQGMKISAVEVRDVPEEERRQYGLEYVGKPEEADRLLGECDFLSMHLHLNQSTRHIIDARRLSLMKPSACLINVARGALVDEAALYQALAEGKLGGAGLDVYGSEPIDPASPILHLPNVVATPHIAGVTDATSRRRAACVAENVNRVAEGLQPLYRIDQP